VLKSCVAFLVGLLAIPSLASAAAWTLPDGTGQWLTTLTLASSTSYLEGSGSLSPTPRYDKDELSALIEYGVTDRLTAIFEPGLQHIDIAAPTDAERTGLGYTEFGARYAAFETQDKSWVLSGQATVRIPGTFDASNPAAVGYTDVETDLRLLLGHSFTIAGLPAFFDLEAAERVRTAGLPSEFRADGTFGVWVQPRWLILVQSFNVVSEGAGNVVYTGGSYDYEKFQLSAVYQLTPDWSVQGGGYVTYAGQNALQENGLIFGVWRKF
jgi:protein XagA